MHKVDVVRKVGSRFAQSLPRIKRYSKWAIAALDRDNGAAGNLSLRQHFQLAGRGFRVDPTLMYDFREHDLNAYISHQETQRLSRLNGRYGILLDDKLVFHRTFAPFFRCLPTVYGVLEKGRFDPEYPRVEDDLEMVLRQALATAGLVAKPVRGRLGLGVVLFTPSGGDVAVNGQVVDYDTAVGRLLALDGYIVVERVVQADYAARIYPSTANTLRLLTLCEPNTRRCFVASATHRFGTSASFPVDNRGRGGLLSRVDIATGTLGEASDAAPEGRGLVWRDRHPETGERISGVQIPRWAEIVAVMEALASRFPFLPYVGWDLIVSEDGPRLIEGNANPGLEITQCHGPLLSDPRVRDFVKAAWEAGF